MNTIILYACIISLNIQMLCHYKYIDQQIRYRSTSGEKVGNYKFNVMIKRIGAFNTKKDMI